MPDISKESESYFVEESICSYGKKYFSNIVIHQ